MVEEGKRFEHRMIERKEDQDLEKEEGNGVSKWENEIPRMVLRVLLVEADDSTRQVVTALLRKCGYTVSAVSDGLTAWETLKENAQSVDLILTEMDLPSISGFALLSLVMEHDVCKEIPVIMMSTQDSVSMVFKCMLKGAADYLIKPLRRNELSNLWRHVWRRNSRQVPHNLTVQQKQIPDPASGKHVPRDRSSDSLISDPTSKDRSEKGSDTQSSCTTPYLEVESEKPSKRSRDEFTESNVKKEDSEKMDEGLIMNVCKTKEKSNLYKPEVASCNGAYKSTVSRLEEDHIIAKRAKVEESFLANLINEIKSCRDDEMFTQVNGIIRKLVRSNNSHSADNDGTNKSEYTLGMELSLRGNLSRGSHSRVTNEEPKMTHSNASAFSWYNNSPTLQPLFATHPNCPTKPKESVKESEDKTPFNQSSGNSINDCQQQDEQPMAFGRYWDSQESPRSPQRLEPIPVTGHRFEKLSTGPNGQFLPSLYYVQSNLSPVWSPVSESRTENALFDTNDTSVQCEGRENHLSEENSCYKSTDQAGKDHDDSELIENSKLDPLPADQSNVGYGRNRRSEECTTSIETREENGKANLAPTHSLRRDLNNGQFGPEKFRGMDSVWICQREAALAKFRMKRKDRCFHKKVRYQSRKMLAEQRPRVKGQFVRQTAS